MADRILENYGLMSGNYGSDPNTIAFEDSRSTDLTVTLAEIPFTKSADQTLWFSGDLTLTFTIDNSDGDDALTDITVSDTLDKTKFLFIPGSVVVKLDDAELVLDTDYTVTYTPNTPNASSDLFEVSLLDTGAAASIPVGSVVTISFRGSKVPE